VGFAGRLRSLGVKRKRGSKEEQIELFLFFQGRRYIPRNSGVKSNV